MQYLKQGTAFTFRIGPFVDSTDGVTPETALTIAQADIQISKAGGAFAQTSATTPTTTHDVDGWYQCPLTTTDTSTLGTLTVQINMSGALPVWKDFMVVTANVFDSLFGADVLQTDLVQLDGSATAATGLSLAAYNLLSGAVDNTSTATSIATNLDTGTWTITEIDALVNRTILFDLGTTTAALQGQGAKITAYAANGTITVASGSFTTAPVSGDTFQIV